MKPIGLMEQERDKIIHSDLRGNPGEEEDKATRKEDAAKEFARETVAPWKDSLRPSAHETEDSEELQDIVKKHRKSPAA